MNDVRPTEIHAEQLLDLQPDAVLWMKPVLADASAKADVADFEIRYCNHAATLLLSMTREQVIGSRITAVHTMEGAARKRTLRQCLQVWNTAVPVEHTYYNPGQDRYLNVQCSKMHDGILSITRDRTSEVKADMERREQEKRYQEIIDTSQDGILLLKPLKNGAGSISDFRISYCNKAGFELGHIPNDSVGKTVFEVFPHMNEPASLDLHRQVAENGVPARFETRFTTPDGSEFGWFLVSLTRVGDTVVSRFTDITERKQHEQQIEEQRDLLDNSFEVSYSAVVVLEAETDETGKVVDLRYLRVNQKYLRITGVDENIVGKAMLKVFPGAMDSGIFDLHCQVLETGTPTRREVYYKSEGLNGWYDVSIAKVSGNKLFVTFTDITEQKHALIEINEQKKLLDNLLRHSSNGISVSEMIRNEEGQVIDARTILANNAAIAYTGIPREIYLSKTAVELDPAITGSPYYQMCLKTLETGEPTLSQYLLEATGRWLELTVSKMDDDHLIHIFTDVTPIKETQLQLVRTIEELKRTNANLEEFAYAASHDLQEPLRKIQYFSERLKTSLATSLPAEDRKILERIEAATSRMWNLIEDLLSYSRVSLRPDALKPVALNDVVHQVVQDFEPTIIETGAKVYIDPLPQINGDERQLRQMFQNLVGNALKYRKPGEMPVVTVRSAVLAQTDPLLQQVPDPRKGAYHLIEITDNGIGFQQDQAEKIFQVFHRLHGRSEYEGTGIGLAIVQKVVKNHGGIISALGEPEKGATFRMLLPA